MVLLLLRSSPGFRRLFLAHSVSRAGDAFNTVALVVLVFDLTGSGLGVAGAVMFEVLPVLLLGPIAGLAADRLPRRRLMVGADLARAAVALVLVAVTASVGTAYAVAFGLSAGAVNRPGFRGGSDLRRDHGIHGKAEAAQVRR